MASIDAVKIFLEDVVVASQDLLGIMAPGAEEQANLYVDDKVMSCALSAYNQCESYIRRRTIRGSNRERYEKIGAEILLKTTPVSSVSSVRFRYPATTPPTFYNLVLNEDYYVERDAVYINNSSLMTNISSLELDTMWAIVPVSLEVEYIGGFSRASSDSGLFTGLVSQTVANFHRKETLGLATVRDSGGGSVQQIANSDSIVASAKDSWSGLIYYGSGEYI